MAAHGLANLTLRTLALDPAFAVEHVKAAQVSKSDFVSQSEAKGAWVSLTAGTCTAFETAAGSYEPPMLALALSAVLADPAVSDLFLLRNVQYHRWRGESPGVTGVNLQGPTIRGRGVSSNGAGSCAKQSAPGSTLGWGLRRGRSCPSVSSVALNA